MDRAPTVELIYDRDCPNVERARSMIAAALREVGAPQGWTEWDRADDRTPPGLRHYGSPTVLVDRHDIGSDTDGAPQANAEACRLYVDDTGALSRAPSARRIAAAIVAAKRR